MSARPYPQPGDVPPPDHAALQVWIAWLNRRWNRGVRAKGEAPALSAAGTLPMDGPRLHREEA